MEEVNPTATPVPFSAILQDRLAPTLVIVYLVAALIAFAVIPFLSYSWLQTPFLGALVENNMIFSDIGPNRANSWALAKTRVHHGEQLLTIDGQTVSSPKDLQNLLKNYAVGDTVSLEVKTQSGEILTIESPLGTMPGIDQATYIFAPYLIGLIYLGIGLWVFNLRRADSTGRAFALFSTSAAIMIGALFDVYSTQRLVYLWTFSLGMVGASLIHLALVFPTVRGSKDWMILLRILAYAGGFFLVFNAWPNLNALDTPMLYITNWRALYVFQVIGLGIFLISQLARRFGSLSPVERQQTRITLWSLLIAFTPFVLEVIDEIAQIAFLEVPLFIILLASVFFPIATAFNILRYRISSTDYLMSRAITYAILTILAGFGYVLVVSGLSLIMNETINTSNPFMVGALVFVLALTLNPARIRLQRMVDRIFFRGTSAYRQSLQSFTSELTQAVELKTILNLVSEAINKPLLPTRLHIFIYDQLTDLYLAAPGQDGHPTTDLRFGRNSNLIQTLTEKQTTLFLSETDIFPVELRPEKPRIALLGTNLFVAMPGRDRLAGWIALGPRRSGEVYSSRDLSYLGELADQAALAIERSQVLADKDRRVHEMNVLTRVAQGVNITLNFDDILELIYAQTQQVIMLSDFNITLVNPATNMLYHAFYLENDERMNEREDRYIPTDQGLERTVISTRRPLLTEEFNRECRNRRVFSDRDGVFAWMGIPLTAGSETIGAIALGSRDPAVLYSQEQSNILQAIGDQVAGAIVKARLLEETQRRARQLASLNTVARGLTSTLELEPLLNSILNNAVTILNCEAGSLLLVDHETNELVFEVVVGPVADDLIGDRLAPGVGLVGKAVTSRSPVIVNNVDQSREWYDKDQETGYQTEGLLVVPMIFKDQVIGVLEVINKKDGQPFDNDDQEILTAYAGQAAVAVENARLYTLTDQKLAERVEELSVMQRIDRELNTSLDVSRAMRITLEWAMRQSEANAGLIGFVSEDGIQIVAAENFNQMIQSYEDSPMPLELPAMKMAVAQGEIVMREQAELQLGTTLSPRAQSQVVIPISREAEVIGLLLLESEVEPRFSEESQSFLTRLSDHAAIAISNAQLYAEVQRANIAKSDFVSFVSHELKNPMTSIRGYAELLSAGAVGDVSDAQQDFLLTIRTNINRMATLVSDLADVSRIEAGRLHLDFAAVEIPSVVNEVVRSSQAMFEEKEQELVIDIPEDIVQVWGDRNRLVQVLTNLISNAYKYTPEGGQITIRARQVDNQWDPEGASQVVHLQVIDTGIGIKPEDQVKIFTQYFRTEEGKDFAPGTGLGLNITRYLVEMQGGKIWFESEYGSGTIFQFTVPIEESELVE